MIRPTSPARTSRPSSSTIRRSVPPTGLPAVSGATRRSAGTAMLIMAGLGGVVAVVDDVAEAVQERGTASERIREPLAVTKRSEDVS